MLIPFAAISALGGEETRDRARAEGVVILEILKERSVIVEVVTVDLPTHEVALIRKAEPELARMLLSTAEAKPPRKLPGLYAQISITVIKIDSTDATILAGPPLVGRSGSLDRFVLKKRDDRWVVVRRDRNYVEARNASNTSLEATAGRSVESP